jgi:multisubunit Na+/H+ antiporter MnhG subunit
MMTLIFWELLCVALFLSVFDRFVQITTSTRLEIRLALLGVGLAALVGLAAPLYGWLPDLVTLIIVSAIVIMQTVMAQLWRDGVPRQFIYDFHRPKRRAGDVPH